MHISLRDREFNPLVTKPLVDAFSQFMWVWLLFGNELPPLHRLKEALLVLVNMEGPVLLEML